MAMDRRFILPLLLLGALVAPSLAPSSVQAAPFSPGLEYAYRLANHYWGGPPANCLSVEEQIVPNLSLEGGAAAEATIASEPTNCILYMSRFLANPEVFKYACAVMVHEDGHLHGLEHSTDPNSVMYWTLDRVPDICKTSYHPQRSTIVRRFRRG